MQTPEERRDSWLKRNGFNEKGETWLVKGETYSIKEEIKKCNGIYTGELGWHFSSPCEEYKDRLVYVSTFSLGQFMQWGDFCYRADIAAHIKSLTKDATDEKEIPKYHFYDGIIGERIKDISATLVFKKSFMGKFGPSNIYGFEDNENHYFVWFSQKNLEFENDDEVSLTGTIKNFKDYNGVKQTLLTRCIIK